MAAEIDRSSDESSAPPERFPETTHPDCDKSDVRAGPAGQPSHLITAEMLAPRATFSGGVAAEYGQKSLWRCATRAGALN
jgi:hypothetical protein